MKEREHSEELEQIDKELEKLFDRFADLITRRRRLIHERETKSGNRPDSSEKKGSGYVRHQKR